MVSERGRTMAAAGSVDVSCPGSPIMTPHHSTCSTTVLIVVLHAGSVLGELCCQSHQFIDIQHRAELFCTFNICELHS